MEAAQQSRIAAFFTGNLDTGERAPRGSSVDRGAWGWDNVGGGAKPVNRTRLSPPERQRSGRDETHLPIVVD